MVGEQNLTEVAASLRKSAERIATQLAPEGTRSEVRQSADNHNIWRMLFFRHSGKHYFVSGCAWDVREENLIEPVLHQRGVVALRDLDRLERETV